MMIKKIFTLVSFLLIQSIYSQITETIPLVYDTSGYSNDENSNLSRGGLGDNDVIPTIKTEMNVSDSGSLTFMVPIEVFLGKNNFQPNISLGYNSQSGNGQAGWGWNIVGLSMITQGGKSKIIDGNAVGLQYDGSDPYYLDGQRLLSTDQINFETEKYSKIKITKNSNSGTLYSVVINYTDGKIAKYKELVSGQNYISEIIDSFGNAIHYEYIITNNLPRLNFISYGGNNITNDKFKINFNYIDRFTITKAYRNGVEFNNNKILSEIVVSSSYLTDNNGLYRKYKLYYDLIQENSVERLIKIEVENELSEKLKPLQFGYNNSTTASLEISNKYEQGLPSLAKGLGSVAIGDFYKTGTPSPIYEAKMSDSEFKLYSPKTGVIDTYSKSKDYFVGRTLTNYKISEYDQLIAYSINYLGDNSLTLPIIDQLKFSFKDLLNTNSKDIIINLPGGSTSSFQLADNYEGSQVGGGATTLYHDKNARKILSGDYNNDGLIDVLIFEKSNNLRPQKIYFAEIGLNPAGILTPTEINFTNINLDSDFYQIEFNGDGVPDLLLVNKISQRYSIYKLNLTNNTLIEATGQQNILLSDFTEKTPLIFGDYNGDGLTDFITPKKIYNIEGSSAAVELQKMEIEQQEWWEYLSSGTGYLKTLKDYTSQKLAYMAPSQRNIIKKSSTWAKFWSGTPDSYEYTEYGCSTQITH